jgi:hypothetical protein
MTRHLTAGERQILQPIFKDALRYHTVRCDINKANVGGRGNSITPAGTAYFSQDIYCEDFSAKDVAESDQWVFVHEMAHAWQWQHGRYPVYEAIGTYFTKGGKYEKAYPYDLTSGSSFDDYNLEQQASIVADYWGLLTGKLRPQQNKNAQATKNDYLKMMTQLWNSGAPSSQLDGVPL